MLKNILMIIDDIGRNGLRNTIYLSIDLYIVQNPCIDPLHQLLIRQICNISGLDQVRIRLRASEQDIRRISRRNFQLDNILIVLQRRGLCIYFDIRILSLESFHDVIKGFQLAGLCNVVHNIQLSTDPFLSSCRTSHRHRKRCRTCQNTIPSLLHDKTLLYLPLPAFPVSLLNHSFDFCKIRLSAHFITKKYAKILSKYDKISAY